MNQSNDGPRYWNKRTRTVLLVIGIVIGITVVPWAIAQVTTNDYQIGENATYEAPNGLSIEAGQDITTNRQHPFPNESTVDFGPEVTFVSNGDAHARVSGVNQEFITLSELQVDNTELKVTSNDHSEIHVEGSATELSYSDIVLDDDQTDLTVTTNGQTTIDVLDFPSNTVVLAIDSNTGDLIQTVETDNSGQGTLSIGQDRDIEFVAQTNTPAINDVSPNDEYVTDDYSVSISANISDTDFAEDWGDSVDVTIYNTQDDSVIYEDTLTSNQVITTEWSNLDMGPNTFNITAQDSYGNEVSIDERTVYTPNTLYVRNEINRELVDNASSQVNVTFFSSNGENIVERETSDGTVSLTGLPSDTELIVSANAEGYYSRTITIDSIIEQQSIYLLPEDSDSSTVLFELEDTAGEYTQSSSLIIERPMEINGSTRYRTLIHDQFGIGGLQTVLENNVRYRISIETQNGERQILGPYTTSISETVTILPSSGIIPIESEGTWSAGATYSNQEIFVRFVTEQTDVSSISITIHERGNDSNTLVTDDTYTSVDNLQVSYPVPDQYNESNWRVEIEVSSNGQTESISYLVGPSPSVVPAQLDSLWRQIIAVAILISFGMGFSVLNKAVGGIAIGVVGGMLFWIGWLEGVTVGAAITLYLFLAVIYAVFDKSVR